MRAFVAIPVPEDIRDRLAALQADLPVGRLADPETFHITLAFLGEEPVERIEALFGSSTKITCSQGGG